MAVPLVVSGYVTKGFIRSEHQRRHSAFLATETACLPAAPCETAIRVDLIRRRLRKSTAYDWAHDCPPMGSFNSADAWIPGTGVFFHVFPARNPGGLGISHILLKQKTRQEKCAPQPRPLQPVPWPQSVEQSLTDCEVVVAEASPHAGCRPHELGVGVPRKKETSTWTFQGFFVWRSLSGVGASIGDPFEGAGINTYLDLPTRLGHMSAELGWLMLV